jgi:hypothetical protein
MEIEERSLLRHQKRRQPGETVTCPYLLKTDKGSLISPDARIAPLYKTS